MPAMIGAGAAYGTAKAGIGILHVSTMRPDLMMRSTLPVIMAGIVALYGVIIDIVIMLGSKFSLVFAGLFIVFRLVDRMEYSLYMGALHLGAGLCVGLSGLAAGIAIGIVGDAGVRGVANQPRLFVGMVLILIFAEVLGIYGMFISLIMVANASKNKTCSNTQ